MERRLNAADTGGLVVGETVGFGVVPATGDEVGAALTPLPVGVEVGFDTVH